MCRLFGQHAHPEFDLCEPLCTAERSLRFLSHQHPHGWGIGWWEAGVPRVRKGLLPAHSDENFVAAARGARSDVVVAHVRDASIGPVTPANTHPFAFGRWLFAHNGTLARYKKVHAVRDAILAEVDPDLRPLVRGETDSERLFLLFLGRLRARAPLDGATAAQVRRALAETTEVAARIADAGTEKPSSMNFLVSDGRVLVACRRGRSLHLAADAGPRHAFVVASEPVGSGARWEEIPEGGFVATEDGRRVVRGALAA
ncbi:MAG TPA: class II glutamine amidotransferase [Anaeromyxobacter sp.]|nr:class II glutamine amidotransferase [Anaeromyxobacter sp.]